MQTIERGKSNAHYLSRAEYQGIVSLGSKDPITKEYPWAKTFKEGDIIHINEGNGKNSTYFVRRVLQIEQL